MKNKVKYLLVVKYDGTVNDFVACEDKSQDKVIQEYKRLKAKYSHLKFKLIKQTEEVIKL